MLTKKNFVLILVLIIGAGVIYSCSSNKRSYKSRTRAPNDLCCAYRSPRGVCYQELVPGCSSDAAPLFKEQFLAPDNCCEHWSPEGICYKELVKGCSERRF
jgi:hypothetical protein